VSDSIEPQKEFNAGEFARNICENKKTQIWAERVRFRKGWSGIFHSLIKAIGKYNVRIRYISDKHKFLDVEVDLAFTSKAKDVYKAILMAKHDSLRTCAHCGERKTENNLILCEDCNANAAEIGATGTWLDNFRKH
jgi:hypothetical protein